MRNRASPVDRAHMKRPLDLSEMGALVIHLDLRLVGLTVGSIFAALAWPVCVPFQKKKSRTREAKPRSNHVCDVPEAKDSNFLDGKKGTHLAH